MNRNLLRGMLFGVALSMLIVWAVAAWFGAAWFWIPLLIAALSSLAGGFIEYEPDDGYAETPQGCEAARPKLTVVRRWIE